MLRVDVLGPVLVGVDDGAQAAERDRLRPSGRALVARLALAHGRTVAADQLVDDLWGEELPAHPVAALRVVASRTRKVLGPAARLAFEHGGYRLEAVELDADRFDDHCHRGRAAVEAGRPDAAAAAFAAALALWRGDALADVRSAPFTVPEAARLDAARLAALDQRIAADLGAGHHQQLVGELAALVGRHPLQERLWAHRMVALYRDGRQADALRAYDEVRQVLAEQLGLEPGPELRDLQQAVLLQDPRLDPPRVHAGAATEPALPVAVPAEPGTGTAAGAAAVAVGPERGPFHRSALIGRRDEVDAAVEALGSHRLVTFVGPAGVGKTRLAAEVASLWSAESSPVRFLELSPLDGQDAIVEALAACAGVTLAGQGDTLRAVLARLRDERGLLVLDCCEHVREAAAAVAEQVVAHTRLTVLATSRTPLLVDGEVRLRIDPLPIDDAVALFGARCGGLALSDRGAAIAVCEAVDRLPLAVELAAGLARTLTVDEVAARIGERLQLLTVPPPSAPPHHRTLRAALEWGHDLLAEADRTLYRRLAVFSGGWTLRAAEATCADPALPAGAVAPALVRLVDASLVTISVRDGRSRFAMLDTMRELAAERLEASHEVDTVRARHLRWCRELVADAGEGDGSELEREHDNLRARWSATGAPSAPRRLRTCCWRSSGRGSCRATWPTAAACSSSWPPTSRCRTPSAPRSTATPATTACTQAGSGRPSGPSTSAYRSPGPAGTASCWRRTGTTAGSCTCSEAGPSRPGTPSPRCWRSCAGSTAGRGSARRSTASPTSPTFAGTTRPRSGTGTPRRSSTGSSAKRSGWPRAWLAAPWARCSRGTSSKPVAPPTRRWSSPVGSAARC